MSAFLVERVTINSIITWIELELSNDFSLITFLAKEHDIDLSSDGWQVSLAGEMYQLNIDAVHDRYEGREREQPSWWESLYSPIKADVYQVLKSMQCWLYQCTEGDCDKEPLYRFIDAAVRMLALSLIEEMPQYQKSKWG